MKLPRVHIALGVREDGSCATLYAGAKGEEADQAYRNAPETPGQIGGALLFKFPEPAKRRTFPVTAAAEEPAAIANVEDLAGALYEKYAAAVGGVAFNGDPLPKWAEFAADPVKAKQADAWREVAATAAETVARAVVSELGAEPVAEPASSNETSASDAAPQQTSAAPAATSEPPQEQTSDAAAPASAPSASSVVKQRPSSRKQQPAKDPADQL